MTDLRPIPTIDADGEPFWSGALDGRLLLQQCTACGTHRFYPRLLCPTCWSDEHRWTEASGTATVYSVSIVHRAPFPALRAETPYTVALVDLDEGVRMFTRLVGDPSTHQIGARVAVRYQTISEKVALPVFEAVTTDSDAGTTTA